jgi:hypothetical protein
MTGNFLMRRAGGLALLLLAAGTAGAGPVDVISSSPLYVTPETVSQAPAGFGAFGGDYFIPDFNGALPNGSIWVVPPGGGAPVSFSTVPDGSARGGLFLPDTGWGDDSGKFVTVGPTYVPGTTTETGVSQVFTYGPTGTASLFLQTTGGLFSFAQPQIAPAGFGAFGGQLVVANAAGFLGGANNVVAINPAGTMSVVADTLIQPFGLAFAPSSGFGAFDGQMFVSSSNSGQIVAVAADGTVTPFADVPLQPGQTSLFQMAFSPAGYLPGQGPLLFVSVRGSSSGGGTLGDIAVIDSSGQVIAHLRDNIGLTKFDPRGLYFPDNQTLIVSDTSDPILSVLPAAFEPVPEPSSVVLFALGTAGLAVAARGRVRRVRIAS